MAGRPLRVVACGPEHGERIVARTGRDRVEHVVFCGSDAAGHVRNCTARE